MMGFRMLLFISRRSQVHKGEYSVPLMLYLRQELRCKAVIAVLYINSISKVNTTVLVSDLVFIIMFEFDVKCTNIFNLRSNTRILFRMCGRKTEWYSLYSSERVWRRFNLFAYFFCTLYYYTIM